MMERESLRLFLALDLPPDINSEVERITARLQDLIRGVRWVKSDGVHLTLKFLGNVNECDIVRIDSALRPLCNREAPFNLTPDQLGFFPPSRRPRVIWLGVKGDLKRLSELHAMLEKSCSSLGFEADKRLFSPHVTLGRVRHPQEMGSLEEVKKRFADINKNIKIKDFGHFQINNLFLYSSELKRDGAVHTKLRAFPLNRNAV